MSPSPALVPQPALAPCPLLPPPRFGRPHGRLHDHPRPTLSDADVQLAGTELLAAEILQPGRSSKNEFASWIAALTEAEILDVLEKRKSFKKVAVNALEEMRAKRQAELERLEAEKKKFEEQLEKAREERTIELNVKTGKMELIKEP